MDSEIENLVVKLKNLYEEIDELIWDNPMLVARLLSEGGAPFNVSKHVEEALALGYQDHVCDVWEALESIDAIDALAMYRSTLNRVSKKMFKYPLTVVDGALVRAATRARLPDR